MAVQVLSCVIGITHAYILHRFVTYRSTGVWWQEYIKFYIVYGSQTLFAAVVFFLFSTFLGYNAYIVQLTVTIVMTVISYWAHKNFSFRKGKQ